MTYRARCAGRRRRQVRIYVHAASTGQPMTTGVAMVAKEEAK